MLTYAQRHDMLPLYRQAQYHLDMAKIARNLRDFSSENFHSNEYRRLMHECMEIGGFLKDK